MQAEDNRKQDLEANICTRWMRLGSAHGSTMRNLMVFYRSPNIVRVIKSRRLRWAGHIARMGEGRSAFKILTG